MKLRSPQSNQCSGISLVETLVYISCLSVLFGIVAVSCWKVKAYHDAINRRTDMVARLLDVGEKWRADIRAADKIQTESDMGIHFTRDGRKYSYLVKAGDLSHESEGLADLLLKNVNYSRMQQLERNGVSYWQWELGVSSAGGKNLQRFTFMAVPQKDKEKAR